MTTGQRIRSIRKAVRMTQVQLADKIGVSKQTMYKYEMDLVNTIPYDKLQLISQLLNTTPAYLLGWEEADREDDEAIARTRRLRAYFLSLYDKLDEFDRGRLVGSAETMLQMEKYKTAKTREE